MMGLKRVVPLGDHLKEWKRRAPKRTVFVIAAVITLTVVLTAPVPVAGLATFLFLSAGTAWISRQVTVIRRERRQEQHKVDEARARQEACSKSELLLENLEHRLWKGSWRTALDGLREFAITPGHPAAQRARALEDMASWYESVGEGEQALQLRRSALLTDDGAPTLERVRSVMGDPEATRHFDVLMISHFGLPGGTTGSNAQEIEAQARAGLRTGLLHHPIHEWGRAKPLSPKIMELVDGDRVQLVHWSDRITCDLLLIRHPKICDHLVDDLPDITAGHIALIINQPPCRYYGSDGAGEKIWDVNRVHEGLLERFGAHSWYPIGPAVRDALTSHHGAELPAMPLAPADWVNIIDVEEWRRAGPRAPDGTVRIGRHSRDHVSKWPETRELLEAAYPRGNGHEFRVLGGAESPERLLGGLPDTWRVYRFDSVPVRQFLHELDVYVYFTATDYLEAFGRSPLEAMAVGLPTIMPSQFKTLFGDAGIYTEPSGVRAELDLLMTDPDRCARQVERAWEVVRDRFSYDAHLRRLAEVGVRNTQLQDRSSVPGEESS